MSIDMPAYFARIGYTGPHEASLAVLHALQARHPAAIAFEALDPFLGRPVQIDTPSIHAKLIHGGRGGYCQEHNGLFYEVLRALGFDVTPLGARVVWMTGGRISQMSHRMTLVSLTEGQFIADVGFGGQTPTAPLRLEPGLQQPTAHGTYRIVRDETMFETQMRLADRWEPMYRFNLEPQAQPDYEMANWFTSTHPQVRFTRNLIAARVVGGSRVNLFNRTLTTRNAEGAGQQRELVDAADLAQVLQETMGLQLPVSADELWSRLPASAFA